jgi:hypothetical protein
VKAAEAYAVKRGLQLVLRPDVLSDCVLYRYPDLPELLPNVQIVNYTKVADGWARYADPPRYWPENVHLTYSINEKTKGPELDAYFEAGFNCAAVFYPEVPETWSFFGKEYEIHPGDYNDLRHLDPRGKIVGLKYKKARPKCLGTRKQYLPTESNGFIHIVK